MSDVEQIRTIIERHRFFNQKEPMNRADIRTLRHYIKILAEREDHLRSLTTPDARHFAREEAEALEWALSVLVPLVKLKEAKMERMSVEASMKRNQEEIE